MSVRAWYIQYGLPMTFWEKKNIYIYFLRIYRPKCHWWSTLYVTGSDWHNFVSFLVYIEAGRSTSTTTLTFTTASTSGITWKARVSQIECSRWVSSASFLVYFPYNLHLHFYVVNSPLALFATRMVALSYHFAVTQKR